MTKEMNKEKQHKQMSQAPKQGAMGHAEHSEDLPKLEGPNMRERSEAAPAIYYGMIYYDMIYSTMLYCTVLYYTIIHVGEV